MTTDVLPGDMIVVRSMCGFGVFAYTKGPNVGSDGFLVRKGSAALVLSHRPAGDGLNKAWCYVLVDGGVGWVCEVWVTEVIRYL